MIQITNEDNIILMQRLKNESIDIICIDPPYLYLKNQKLERKFDEQKFFEECKRILTKNGFLILFGRGASFYRWNTILAGIGFTFKEEIIWDKSQGSSPLMPLTRVHETVAIHTKKAGKIKRVKVPYLEMKFNNFDSIISDVKRLKSVLTNEKSNIAALNYIENGVVAFDSQQITRYSVTGDESSFKGNDRAVSVLKAMEVGLNEKSIIKHVRDHYSSIHPTQKPVRLLERLLALCLPDKPKNEIMIADFFGGSMSTMEACINLGVNGISCEIDKEYFDKGYKRIFGENNDFNENLDF